MVEYRPVWVHKTGGYLKRKVWAVIALIEAVVILIVLAHKLFG